VLLTPVVLAVAVRLRINPVPLAMTTVLLANTASLFLPVSNLTNLLALSHLDLSAVEYVALMALPGLVAVLVTVAVLAVLHRRTLALPRRAYDEPAPLAGPRAPVVVAAAACVALGPALTLTGRVTVVSGIACGAVVLACLVWRRDLLHLRLVPWLLVLAVAGLFFLVQLAHEHGLTTLAGHLTGTGQGPLALLRLTGVTAGSANVIDNLPAYLALEPTTAGSPERLGALLVGVGVDPLVAPWASLATLLWAQRCHAAGLAVHWGRFALTGVLVAVPAVTLALGVVAG
jgi:arsenical pump membrane protein